MKIEPLHDYVLIRRMPSKDTTPGGIVIPGTAKRPLSRATVMAAGPGKVSSGRLVEPSVRAGQTVLLTEHAFVQETGVDGEVLIRESELLATVWGDS